MLTQEKIDYKIENGNKLLVNSKDKNKAEFLIASTPELLKNVANHETPRLHYLSTYKNKNPRKFFTTSVDSLNRGEA